MGFATLVIDGAVQVNDVRVLTGKNGIYAGMPSVKNREGDYVNLCNPVTAEMNAAVNKAVDAAYSAAVDAASKKQKVTQQLPELSGNGSSISVSVHPLKAVPDSNTVGMARVTVSEHFVIGNIKVVKGKNGIFPSMPSVSVPPRDGDEGAPREYKDVCKVSDSLRNALQKAVREGYNKAMDKGERGKVSVQEILKEKQAKAKAAPAAEASKKDAPAI
jgi:stage V sporulation protein G